jgi:DNA-binding transcriptional MocR family regulator
MNAGATTARVYETLKELVTCREFRPGDRVDPAALAERLASSVTPVRDALNLLTGEGLIESRMASGYFLPQLDEPSLKDMLAWSSQIVGVILRNWEPRPVIDWDRIADREPAYPARMRDAFEVLSLASPNEEHRRALAAIGARLHAVRHVEPHIFEFAEKEALAFELAIDRSDRAEIRRISGYYHRSRARAASSLVRAVYRAD